MHDIGLHLFDNTEALPYIREIKRPVSTSRKRNGFTREQGKLTHKQAVLGQGNEYLKFVGIHIFYLVAKQSSRTADIGIRNKMKYSYRKHPLFIYPYK